jgi:hypothetical protein
MTLTEIDTEPANGPAARGPGPATSGGGGSGDGGDGDGGDGASTDPPDADLLPLTAYRATNRTCPIEPAPVRRAWMDQTSVHFANRCLPMLMANQAGWWVPNPRRFTARWDGRDGPLGVRIDYDAGRPPYPASSHFGHGIVTFHIPLLIRTPPGWNLLVRGPSNLPKDGASALEGLVETDWAVATFTANWKLTRPGLTVEFARGEPVCMLVPQRRGDLERFRPAFAPMEAMPDRDAYRAWRDSRAGFLRRLHERRREDLAAASRLWQRDYMLGTAPSAAPDGAAPEHQRRLELHGFADPQPVPEPRRCAPAASDQVTPVEPAAERGSELGCPYAGLSGGAGARVAPGNTDSADGSEA